MLSPPVPSASPKWPAYRVAFVEELTDLWLDLLRSLEERLERAGTPFGLAPARRAIERECRKLARRVTTREAPLPGSKAWLAESRRRIRLAPAKATPRVKNLHAFTNRSPFAIQPAPSQSTTSTPSPVRACPRSQDEGPAASGSR
jgi:hypothetical protein